jgi:hypothetical protein
MKKIATYIKQGKGTGLLFLLAGAVVMTLFFIIPTKEMIRDIEPKVMLVAKDFLPITIENQKITSPIDTYKRLDVDLSFDNSEKDLFPVVLDTKNQNPDLTSEKLGLFITKDAIFAKTNTNLKRIEYIDGTYDINTFNQLYNQIMGKISLIASLVFIGFFFINLLIKAIIISLACLVISKILKQKNLLTFPSFMRLSSIIIAILEIINIIIISVFSIPTTGLHILLLGIILAFLYLQKYNQDDAV